MSVAFDYDTVRVLFVSDVILLTCEMFWSDILRYYEKTWCVF